MCGQPRDNAGDSPLCADNGRSVSSPPSNEAHGLSRPYPKAWSWGSGAAWIGMPGIWLLTETTEQSLMLYVYVAALGMSITVVASTADIVNSVRALCASVIYVRLDTASQTALGISITSNETVSGRISSAVSVSRIPVISALSSAPISLDLRHVP